MEMGKEVSMGPLAQQLQPCLCSVVDLCGSHSTRGPRGPPNRPRVQGSVLGEVLAASPDHQWLGVRTDVPWDRQQYIRSRILAFSFPRSRWVLG